MEKATFAAGCFWGVEARFREIDGVIDTRVGYTGGHLDEPDYRRVCAGDTGHAESVEVTFDPEKVSYEDLVSIFFAMHDPTSLDRQGPDIGKQYRSAIFTHSAEQQKIAERVRDRAQATHHHPIVTEIVPVDTFWRAEEYHQRYLEKQGNH